jgi:hypothetical protein
MSNIVLVGTVHSDFRGPERLMKILNFYRNPLITLESTVKDAEEARSKHSQHKKSIEDKIMASPGVFSESQIFALRAYVNSMSYESNTPYAFQEKKSDSLIFPIGVTIENLDKWMDYKVQQYIASGGDISKLTGLNDPSIQDLLNNGLDIHQKAIDETYKEDDCSFMKNIMGEIFPYLANKRDELFAKQIKELEQQHPERAIVGIFGTMHIFGNYEGNLYEQLDDLKPTRIKLIEADNF